MSVIVEKLTNLIDKPISGEWGDGEGTVNVLRSTNFKNDGTLDFSDVVRRDISTRKIEQKALKVGDTIIEKSGGSPNQPVGRVVYFENADSVYLCNNFTSILRPNQYIFPKYLFWQLFNNHLTGNTLRYQNKTTGIINLQLERYLNEISIPVVPIPTQKHIAAILDKADALRKKDQQLLKYYDDLAQSLFIEMFGDPVKNEKGWEIKKLGDLITIDCTQENPKVLKDFKYVGLEHIEKFTGEITFESNIELLSSKFKFGPEHILYGKLRPYLNKVAMPTFSGICSTDIYPILTKPFATKEFILKIMQNEHFVNRATSASVGANLPRANKNIILSYKTISPPFKLQNQFAAHIQNIEKQKEKVKAQIQASEQLFKALLQQAFSAGLN